MRVPVTMARGILFLGLACLFSSLLAGCGGGKSSQKPAVLPDKSRGKVSVTIHWPESRAKSRLVPAASQGIRVAITDTTPENKLIAEQIAQRPAPGTWETTLTFVDLQAGAVRIVATAHPNRDGSGVAQARGVAPVTITAGETASANLTMGSTIERIAISPADSEIWAGQGEFFDVTAYDTENRVVITTPNNIQWTNANPGIATLSSLGAAFGVAPGTATIEARETESGKTTTTRLTVKAAAPSPTENIYLAALAFGNQNRIVRHRFSAGFQDFHFTPPTESGFMRPYELVVGPDGKVHTLFYDKTQAQVGTLNPQTGDWTLRTLATWPTHDDLSTLVTALSFAVKGNYLYVSNVGPPSSTAFRGILRMDLTTGEVKPFITDTATVCITLGWDGLLYVADYRDQRIKAYIPETGRLLKTVAIPVGFLDFAVGPRGEMYFCQKDNVQRFSPEGTLERTLNLNPVPNPDVHDIDLSLDGRLILGTHNNLYYRSDANFSFLFLGGPLFPSPFNDGFDHFASFGLPGT